MGFFLWPSNGGGGGGSGGGPSTDADAIHKSVAAELAGVASKATPAPADVLLIEDSEESGAKKKVLVSSLPTGSGGEANTASNAGSAADGEGIVKGKTGLNLAFKRIKAASNLVAVSASTDSVLIDVNVANLPAGDGEANTASNAGSAADGEGIVKGKVGVDLRFFRIKPGTAAEVTTVGDSVVFGVDLSAVNIPAAQVTGLNAAIDARTVPKANVTGLTSGPFVNAGHIGAALVSHASVSGAQAIALDAGNAHKLTLTGNATLSFTGAVAGLVYALVLAQDATGGRTVTWPASVKWAGGSPPTLTADPNALDIVTILFDGGNFYGNAVKGFA